MRKRTGWRTHDKEVRDGQDANADAGSPGSHPGKNQIILTLLDLDALVNLV
jgi:hypothetical protein